LLHFHLAKRSVSIMVFHPRTRALVAPCVLGVALAYGAAAPSTARSAPIPAPTPSPSAPAEIGRVTTSDRQDEPAAATARTTYVVTKAEMRLHGDATVADALDDVPGVFIERQGPAGAYAPVTIRGQRDDGVLVLLDGRPIAGGEIGDIDLGSIPTAGVERIEVVEGAGATLYGNGAAGGVINIITAPAHAAGRTPDVSLSGGSYGEGRFALETSTFSFAREIAANDFPYAVPGGGGATRTNADLSATNARFADAGTFGALAVSGSAGFSSRILGVPGQLGSLTSFARQEDDASDARLSLALQRPQALTTLDLSGSRETLDYEDPSALEYGPYLDLSTDGRAQASLRDNVVSNANRLVYGVDLAHGVARNDGGNGDFAATPYAQTALYAQDSLAVGGGSRIYGGLRGERDGASGAALVPALGGIAALGEGVSLRLNAGSAFRVPTAEDLDFPGFSNPLLQPERMQSFDATVDAAHVLGGASLGWFVQTANELITVNPAFDYGLPPSSTNEPLINEQQSSTGGFILDVATPRFAGIAGRVGVTDTYRALAYNAGAPASRLFHIPVFAMSVDLGYAGPPAAPLAAAGAVAHTVGALDTLGDGDFTTIDAYVRLRLAARALLSLRAYDLGNKRYEEEAGYPMPGRTYAVELSTR
jgi:outer membrane cobalamin receptor